MPRNPTEREDNSIFISPIFYCILYSQGQSSPGPTSCLELIFSTIKPHHPYPHQDRMITAMGLDLSLLESAPFQKRVPLAQGKGPAIGAGEMMC
jgi:hypothetical protein